MQMNEDQGESIFTLLTGAILNGSGLLEGADGRTIFTLNPVCLENGSYYEAERMIAAGIQQEGPGLRCMLPAVFYMIAQRNDLVQLSVEDIPCERL